MMISRSEWMKCKGCGSTETSLVDRGNGTLWRACGRCTYTEAVAPIGTLDAIAALIVDWNLVQFGDIDTLRPKASHLKKEMEELIEDPDTTNEWKDVFFFFACAYYALGPTKMRVAILEKLAKNKRREWQAPDENGVCEHVRGHED